MVSGKVVSGKVAYRRFLVDRKLKKGTHTFLVFNLFKKICYGTSSQYNRSRSTLLTPLIENSVCEPSKISGW